MEHKLTITRGTRKGKPVMRATCPCGHRDAIPVNSGRLLTDENILQVRHVKAERDAG